MEKIVAKYVTIDADVLDGDVVACSSSQYRSCQATERCKGEGLKRLDVSVYR